MKKLLCTPDLSTKSLCVLLTRAVMSLAWSDLTPSFVWEGVCVGACLFFHVACFSKQDFFVLLTFAQPTFKVLFNLSKHCRGSKLHLNYTVSANILPSALRGAWRQLTIYSCLHQKNSSLYLGFKEKCIFIFKTNVYYSVLSSELLQNMSVTIFYSLPSVSLRIKNS